jgi:hypothetical protein
MKSGSRRTGMERQLLIWHWCSREGDGAYAGGVSSGTAALWVVSRYPGGMNLAMLASRRFVPGRSWHTYRLEVKGNTLSLFIDKTRAGDAIDNRLPEGRQVGLFTTSQVNIRSCRVIPP